MNLINPLRMNDWSIKQFLPVIFTVQILVWSVIFLDFLNLNIPILKQLLLFVYLTFIPGILILRILRIHNLDTLHVLLYSVGMSLSTLMFLGFFMNTIFPLLGIARPISFYPLVYTIGILVVVLSILTCIRDRSFSSPEYISIRNVLSPPVLVLSFLPVLAFFAISLFNYNGNNILLMILLLLIALFPIVTMLTNFFQEKYYPIIIFILTVTLLYSHSLVSAFIYGWDINSEYYVVNSVIQEGLWNPALYGSLNGMLSLTMLGPIYSIILSMSLDGVFKIIYPLIFAFVPLGLYPVFRKQTDNKIAFLACFFFISFFVFYLEMLTLARQEIAEFFLVLIILSLYDKKLEKFSKSFLLILFISSLIVSHYGLSYLFLLIFILTWTIGSVGYYAISREYMVRFFIWLSGKSGYQDLIEMRKYFSPSHIISFSSVAYYCVFLVMWYMYTAGSASFAAVITIANQIFTSTQSDFLDPGTTQGLAIATTTQLSTIHELAKYLHLFTIFLIVVGFLSSVILYILYKKVQHDFQYLLLSFGALCLCLGGLVLPYFASSINTTRLYQISLIFLAPFCVLGGITVFRMTSAFFGNPDNEKQVKIALQILSVFFGIFLLFNSAWFYEIAHDGSIPFLNNKADYPMVTVPQAAGAQWLTDLADSSFSIYSDYYRAIFFNRIYGPRMTNTIPYNSNRIPAKSYVFLGNFNIINNKILLFDNTRPVDPGSTLANRSRIYDSGGAEVYYR
jgi:uncharacterized membrane protein